MSEIDDKWKRIQKYLFKEIVEKDMGFIKKRKKEIILLITMIILCLFFLELISRFMFASQYGLPLFYKKEEVVYPKLYTEMQDYDEEKINVLLLGGSVLNRVYCWNMFYKHIEDEDFKFYNLAFDGHMTVDSVNKYEYLVSQGYNFDYVVYYHGINDVRNNNIPPELFLEGYEHNAFYKYIKPIFDDQWSILDIMLSSSLVFRLNKYYVEKKYSDKVISFHEVKEEWKKYGSDIKSKKTFSENLLKVIEISKRQNSTLIVPEFAYNMPENYDEELFLNHSLGYSTKWQGIPVESWGDPENVVKGIDEHNKIILGLRDNFVFVNTTDIRKDIKNFIDICHFSEDGDELFARAVIKAIKNS